MDQSTSTLNSHLKRITIFLASPGDVMPEREVADAIIRRVNENLAVPLGFYLHKTGWENILSDVGRPQEIINRTLLESSFFLGIIWKRFGMPSGKEASGFYEEFKLALDLYGEGKIDTFWLYIKEMPEKFAPGEIRQANLVKKFKAEVTANRSVLYKPFKDTQAWEKLLYDDLVKYVTEMHVKGLKEPDKVAKTVLLGASNQENSSVFNSLDLLTDTLQGKDIHKMTAFDLSRITLSIQAIRYVNPTEGRQTVLSAVDFAYLYEKRESIKLTGFENDFVLHSLLGDSEGIKMGWYWFDGLSLDLPGMLRSILKERYDLYLKESSLKILRKIDSDEFNRQAERILAGTDNDLHNCVLNIILGQPTHNDLSLLDRYGDKGDPKKVWYASFQIRASINPDAAVILVKNTSEAERSLPEKLDTYFAGASEASLKLLLQDENQQVALSAFNALQDSLTDQELHKLVAGTNYDIAFKAALKLVDMGHFNNIGETDQLVARRRKTNREIREQMAKKVESPYSSRPFTSYRPFTDIRLQAELEQPHPWEWSLRVQQYAKKTKEELESNLAWSYSGSICYRVLFETYYEQYQNELRRDLTDRFKTYKRTRSKTDQESTSKLHKLLKPAIEKDDFIHGYFMLEAAKILQRHATPEDIPLAINLLNDPQCSLNSKAVQIQALKILQEKGLAKEANVVELWVKNEELAIQRLAILSLLTLDKLNLTNKILGFLKTGEIRIIRLVLNHALKNRLDLSQLNLVDFLYHEKDKVRLLVLAYLASCSSDEQLQELLRRYIIAENQDQEQYYFDVVSNLDRILYPPVSLKSIYRNELVSNLNDEGWDWRSWEE